MQKIEFVGSHQYCSPFAISITSSGRETVRPAASGGRESRQSRHRMQRDGARGGHRRTSSDAARDAAAWCTATAPGEGFEFGKGGKHLRNRALRILHMGRALAGTNVLARLCCAVSLPQHPMENLPGGSSGHLFLEDERDGLRALVAGDPGPGPRKQLFFGHALPILQHDHGANRFTPYVVRDTDDRKVFHLRMGSKQFFHLGRIDVLATADDHVALAVREIVVTLPVPPGHVSDRAVRATKRGGGLVGQVPVSTERIRSARIEFAYLTVYDLLASVV